MGSSSSTSQTGEHHSGDRACSKAGRHLFGSDRCRALKAEMESDGVTAVIPLALPLHRASTADPEAVSPVPMQSQRGLAVVPGFFAQMDMTCVRNSYIQVLLGFLVRSTLSDSAASPTNPTYSGHLAHHCFLSHPCWQPRDRNRLQ